MKKESFNQLPELASSDNTQTRIRSEIEEIIFEFQEKLLNKSLNSKNHAVILQTMEVLKVQSLKNGFLLAGEQAPNFELYDAMKQKFNLKQALRGSKIILCFFRGGWSPYCYLTLRSLQKFSHIFADFGAKIVAISAERQEDCRATIERNHLEFRILSDPNNRVAELYNLVYRNNVSINLWHELGLNTEINNGEISYELAIPAVYIIDEWMTIRYAFVDPDYRRRVNVDELLHWFKVN